MTNPGSSRLVTRGRGFKSRRPDSIVGPRERVFAQFSGPFPGVRIMSSPSRRREARDHCVATLRMMMDRARHNPSNGSGNPGGYRRAFYELYASGGASTVSARDGRTAGAVAPYSTIFNSYGNRPDFETPVNVAFTPVSRP